MDWKLLKALEELGSGATAPKWRQQNAKTRESGAVAPVAEDFYDNGREFGAVAPDLGTTAQTQSRTKESLCRVEKGKSNSRAYLKESRPIRPKKRKKDQRALDSR